MASWMVHLRVADLLLDRLDGLAQTAFVVGNLAPDSGVPNADWSAFSPDTRISHYKKPSPGIKRKICLDEYVQQFFTPKQQASYDTEAFSFYLGYLCHLMTDILWAERVVIPAVEAYLPQFGSDKQALISEMKEDWYDLDFLYLREHPDFRAFQIYHHAVGFENSYMDFFSRDAFDNRRQFITGYYLGPSRELERHYPYLTRNACDCFVRECARSVAVWLKEYCVSLGVGKNT